MPVQATRAVLAFCAALLLVWSILRVTGDDLGSRRTKRVAVLLPVGGIVATACGVGTAWLYDFTTRPYVAVASTLVVVLVLSATFTAARVWALGGITSSASFGRSPTGSA
ncbi:hypothetical protein ACFULT_04330 [Rhodococcus sp. NPDC057297]|uniref:hypothetical protein n=1 Tax=Rhodococcus sp. NPDC057297 TaxID=3346090 RepID=UPI00362E19E4